MRPSADGYDDGDLPIDNNWVENRIRPISVGRKNWLFAGSLRAGQRAAVIMSLIQSAKLCGHEPYRYLRDVPVSVVPPAATSTSPTRGRVKLPHLAVAGRAMITRFDAPLARRSADSLSRQLLPTNLSR